jgi:hypothetical protein
MQYGQIQADCVTGVYYIAKNWPDAEDIDREEAAEYAYTSRFPKPKWMDPDHD